MSEDCERIRACLTQWQDGDLTIEEEAWAKRHWGSCERCRNERDWFQQFDARLLSAVAGIEPSIGGPIDRQRFLAGLDRTHRRKWPVVCGVVGLAAALAAGFYLARPARPGRGDGAGFVPIPFVAPMPSYERSFVASVEIPVTDLMAEGYSIAADPTSVLKADLLMGEDGRVYAVRLAPGSPFALMPYRE